MSSIIRKMERDMVKADLKKKGMNVKRGTILLYGHVHDNFDNEIYQNALDDLRATVCALNQMTEKQGGTRLKKEPCAYNVGAMLKEVNYTPRTLKAILKEE